MTRNILILAIFLPFLAHALESNRVAVDTGNKLSMHKSNNINIKEIEEHDASISNRFDKYRTCIEKDMVYLGPGASNVDADYCYNLNDTTAGQFRPKFAGLLSGGPYSPYTSNGNYNSNYTYKFTLDMKCNAEYPNSHALVYEDVKYVINEINEDSNVISVANYIPVFDATKGFVYYDGSDYDVVSKSGIVFSKLNECNGWSGSSDIEDKVTVLFKTTLSGNTFFRISHTPCFQDFYIACVYN